MKKMIVTLAVSIISLAAFAGRPYNSPVPTEGEESVTQQVLNAFNEEFASAREVAWIAGQDYYKAAFLYNDKHVFAWYSPEGEFIAMSRYISSSDLPVKLESNLKSKYSDYWISDLFEVSRTEGTTYFVTLENADSKLVLRSSGFGWNVYKKIKKA